MQHVARVLNPHASIAAAHTSTRYSNSMFTGHPYIYLEEGQVWTSVYAVCCRACQMKQWQFLSRIVVETNNRIGSKLTFLPS